MYNYYLSWMNENNPMGRIISSKAFRTELKGYFKLETVRDTTTKITNYILSNTIIGDALELFFCTDIKTILGENKIQSCHDAIPQHNTLETQLDEIFYNNNNTNTLNDV